MSAVLKIPATAEEIISYNPATNEEIGRVENTSAEDVEIAVEKSRVAFQKWRKTSFAVRRKFIIKAREISWLNSMKLRFLFQMNRANRLPNRFRWKSRRCLI